MSTSGGARCNTAVTGRVLDHSPGRIDHLLGGVRHAHYARRALKMSRLDYDMLGEVARLTADNKIARPRPVRDRWGRWHRDPSGEMDWFYGLPETERAYVQRYYMAPDGVEVDVLATMLDMGVDEWSDHFIDAVRAARDKRFRSLDVFDDEWQEFHQEDDDELLGPDEVAELLAVKRNTLAQWRHRQKLPEPFMVLSGMPIFRRGDVMAFAVDTGREVIEVDA